LSESIGTGMIRMLPLFLEIFPDKRESNLHNEFRKVDFTESLHDDHSGSWIDRLTLESVSFA
jgi:hypothetical protein